MGKTHGDRSCWMRSFFSFFAWAVIFVGSLASAADSIQCASGWFGNDEKREVPSSWINDGYCDCPLDGSDELETGACAGSIDGGWVGVPTAAMDSDERQKNYFQCPQQVKVQITMSRLNDGICDCCDGADEPSGICPDICHEVLADERAKEAKAKADFEIGYKKRQEDISSFQKLQEKTRPKIEYRNTVDIPALKQTTESVKTALTTLKDQYMTDRMTAVKTISEVATHGYSPESTSLSGIFQPLSVDEIYTFIVYVCQIYAEIADSSGQVSQKNGNTCTPLRLAGIDLGLLWENEALKTGLTSFKRVDLSNLEQRKEIANIMAKNSGIDISNASIGPDDRVNNHKKVDRYEDDIERDEYHHDNEDYPSMDDDMLHEQDALDAEDIHTQTVDKADDTTDTDTEVKALREQIESTPLSWSRVSFARQAKALLDKIEIMMKTTEDDDMIEDESKQQPQDENTPELDPMAIQMVSGILSKRMAFITRGVDYAVSAKVLLDALENDLKENTEQFHADLIGLAVGTVYHAKIASDEFAELLFMTLSEFDKEKRILEEENEESCVSQLAFMCPPSPYSKDLSDGNTIEFPPKWVVSVAQGLCANRQTGVCVPDDDLDIPTDIPDGYYNYFVPQARDDSDTLSAALSAYDTIASIGSQTAELENQLLDLDNKLKEYNDEVRELEDSIGGNDGMEMGKEGELYPMKDQCFSLEAGKYEYEVCIFGSAKQRDIGQKSGGTDLGKWSRLEIDEESGQKTMLWENGAKCWNGPQRSATVHVTCGAETKVLTADEPDTCRYVFTMESPIGCDEQFGKQYGLL